MSARILVLEDDDALSQMLVFLLEHHGFEVRAVPTIGAARSLATQFLPALMVIDVRVPDGNGLDLLESLRSDPATKSMKAIVMSTENSHAIKTRAQALGALAFWHKPFAIKELAEQVKSAVALP
ncbi:MAG: response regulator transcription factor [Elusimicrobia bacterium]|nr:response regulator transcription factor [Elusimicrobiota bacterium]